MGKDTHSCCMDLQSVILRNVHRIKPQMFVATTGGNNL